MYASYDYKFNILHGPQCILTPKTFGLIVGMTVAVIRLLYSLDRLTALFTNLAASRFTAVPLVCLV